MFKFITDLEVKLIPNFSFIKLPRYDTKHSVPRFPIIIYQMNIEFLLHISKVMVCILRRTMKIFRSRET